MRLWSLSPKVLDTKRLVALWREGLGALKVLKQLQDGNVSVGYRNHPQLNRFKKVTNDPVQMIYMYLSVVYDESVSRGYNFNVSKIMYSHTITSIPVTQGQIDYEYLHLANKLNVSVAEIFIPNIHPLFYIVPGDIEPWEKT